MSATCGGRLAPVGVRAHDVAMTADWERERAEQAEEVAALLAGVADGTIDAYEGAFAAGRILQNGGRLLEAERSRRYFDNEPVDDLPAERDDPRRSILLHMLRALAALPAGQREAIRAHVLDEQPYSELAGRLGVPEATVRQRVSRGLARLRTTLEGRQS
jgi:RNA polymerase sigma factor (sigma-70 family)